MKQNNFPTAGQEQNLRRTDSKISDATLESWMLRALSVIEQHEPVSITELISYLPIQARTFYEMFPAGSPGNLLFKEEIENIKERIKAEMRRNWRKADAAPKLQDNLYKILATDEERRALSTNYSQNENINKDDLKATIVVESKQIDGAPEVAGSEDEVDMERRV